MNRLRCPAVVTSGNPNVLTRSVPEQPYKIIAGHQGRRVRRRGGHGLCAEPGAGTAFGPAAQEPQGGCPGTPTRAAALSSCRFTRSRAAVTTCLPASFRHQLCAGTESRLEAHRCPVVIPQTGLATGSSPPRITGRTTLGSSVPAALAGERHLRRVRRRVRTSPKVAVTSVITRQRATAVVRCPTPWAQRQCRAIDPVAQCASAAVSLALEAPPQQGEANAATTEFDQAIRRQGRRR